MQSFSCATHRRSLSKVIILHCLQRVHFSHRIFSNNKSDMSSTVIVSIAQNSSFADVRRCCEIREREEQKRFNKGSVIHAVLVQRCARCILCN